MTRLGAVLSQYWSRIKNERVKRNLQQAIPFWIASILTGLAAVFYAKLFGWAEHGLLWIMAQNNWLIFALAPVFFFLSWWLIKRYSPGARGSGIPQVMAAIELANPRQNHLVHYLLSLKVLVFKVLSSIAMVLGGGAIGREGPTIQIAGSIFRWVHQLVPDSWPKLPKQNMIVTGAAAGLAAAFNTPLGGIVFAVEELAKNHLRHFRTALFAAVIISGMTAQAFLGPYLYLGYPRVADAKWYMFGLVILAASVSGITGAAMGRMMLKLMRWRKTFSNRQQLIYLGGAALIMCVFGAITSNALGSGKEIMNELLFSDNKHLEWYLPIMRVIGPAVSFTSGGAGGVFAPSLSAGAAIGAATAEIFHFTGANANLLILAGMVGLLTGVTRSPFTSAILVLEMTDRHSVIFHLMLGAMAGSVAAYLVDKKSLYDHLKEEYKEEVLNREKRLAVAKVQVTTGANSDS